MSENATGEPAVDLGSLAARHGTRVAGAAIAAATAYFIATASDVGAASFLIVCVGPLMLGSAFAVVSSCPLSDRVAGLAEMVGCRAAAARDKHSVLRLVLEPLHRATRRVWHWSSHVPDPHLRAAVRAAALCYLCGLTLAALVIVMYAVVVIVALILGVAFVFWVLFHMLGEAMSGRMPGGREDRPLATIPTAVRGVFSRGTSWFNEKRAARVDKDGQIYEGSSWWNEERVGRVDEDGTVYRGSGGWSDTKVGRIDEDGDIHRGSNGFNERKVGRVDEDGTVYEGTSWFNEKRVGRVEPEE